MDLDASKPMIAFINRFARQKGIDIIMPVLEKYLRNLLNLQFSCDWLW
jgi:glycogen synthase